MPDYAIYMYGVVPNDYVLSSDVPGMDSQNSLYFIEYQDIKCIASKVPLEEYGEVEFAKNVENMEWLKQKALLHSDILNQLFSNASSFIPIKFGTVYLCKENAYSFLSNNYSILKQTLEKLDGKEEWGIKLYCDLKKFIETGMSEEKKSVLAQTSDISKGAGYFLHKKLMGKIEDMAKDKLFSISQNMFDQLASNCCEEGKLNKLLSKEATGISLDMYMNAVFLIYKDNVENFKRTIENYKNDYANLGTIIELTGPWPSYNFCNT